MKTLNKVFLLGKIDGPPQRIGDGELAMAAIKIETIVERRGGESHPTWHRAICFGPLAESVLKHMRAGDAVHVEGALSNRSYEKDGEKRLMTEVRVGKLIRVGGGASRPAPPPPPPPKPVEDVFDDSDDVPF